MSKVECPRFVLQLPARRATIGKSSSYWRVIGTSLMHLKRIEPARTQLLRAILLLAAACGTSAVRADSVEFLSPFGETFGKAFGIDGNKVVGSTFSQRAFLYDGTTYSLIAPPGSGFSAAYGISGNLIVGAFSDAVAMHGFLFDGTSYTTLDAPLAVKGTIATGVFGSNIVGYYNDAANIPHSFIYDGTSYTTIDHPLGIRGTVIEDISGDDIVGRYLDSRGRIRGFLYDGTTFSTLNDPIAFGGSTSAMDVDGRFIVGNASVGPSYAFIYDGNTYTHPFGGSAYQFTGISGNKIVGNYHDGPTGLDRPFIYTSSTIPESSSLILALFGTVGFAFFVVIRARMRQRVSSL